MTRQLVDDHRKRLEDAAGTWRAGRLAADPDPLAVRVRAVPLRARHRTGWWMVHAGLRLATVPTAGPVPTGPAPTTARMGALGSWPGARRGVRPRHAPW